jgi:hypothetical protein
MSRSANPLRISPTDPMRDLFEACKGGDILRIRALVEASNVNAKDTAGRRSSPLHFAAGKTWTKIQTESHNITQLNQKNVIQCM